MAGLSPDEAQHKHHCLACLVVTWSCLITSSLASSGQDSGQAERI